MGMFDRFKKTQTGQHHEAGPVAGPKSVPSNAEQGVKLFLRLSPAAIQKLTAEGLSELDAVTMLLAIERRDHPTFEETATGTLQFTASAKAELAAMCVYRDIDRQEVLVTDRQIDGTSKYKLIGWLDLRGYAYGVCKALGLDYRRLRV